MSVMSRKGKSRLVAASEPARPGRWRAVLMGAAIVVVTLTAYSPAMRGGFIWDDDDYVTENGCLRSPAGLGAIWLHPRQTPQYYPLVFTTFWAEYHLWGLNPAGYHIVNVLLHAMAAVLLWRVLRRLGVPGSYLAGLVFALHPVCVESVAWITERKNVLSCLLYLAAFGAYLRFEPPEAPASPRPRRWYAAAAALFVMALWSKTVTFSLPAAIAVALWYRRGRLGWRELLPLFPLLAVGVAMGMVTAHMEKINVGAMGAEWAMSATQRLLVAGHVLCFYAGKFAWPTDLMFFYPRWQINAADWLQWLWPLAAVAALAALWAMRRRLGRGPLAAALVFAGSLTPALGFFDVYPMRYSFVADHFQYHAMMAMVALACGLAAWAWGKIGSATLRRWGAPAAAAVVLAALGALTWQQGHIYRDRVTIYLDTLEKNDTAWIAHNNLGFELIGRKQFLLAQRHLLRALELRPAYPEAYNNLGGVLTEMGRPTDAMEAYRKATDLDANFVRAFYNWGALLMRQGELPAAGEKLNRAATVDPNFSLAHRSLGEWHFKLGRLPQAEQSYRRTVELAPDDMQARMSLCSMLERQGKYDESIVQFRQALARQGDEPQALYYLSCLLSTCPQASFRSGGEAMALARQLALQAGQEIRALDAQGMALAELGQFDEAAQCAAAAAQKAVATGDTALAADIQRRIRLYQSHQPMRLGP